MALIATQHLQFHAATTSHVRSYSSKANFSFTTVTPKSCSSMSWMSRRRTRKTIPATAAYDVATGILSSEHPPVTFPDEEPFIDIATFVLWSNKSNKSPQEAAALVDGISGDVLSFGDAQQGVRSLAARLDAMGVQQGDVVMILAPNSIYFPIAFLAIASIGAIVATPNPLGTADEIEQQAKIANVKFVITARELLYKVDRMCLSSAMIIMDELDVGAGPGADSSPKRRRIHMEDPAAVLYSSGTTGISKGVLLSHRNIIAQILQLAMHHDDDDDDEQCHETVHLCALPMSHIFGSVVVALQQLYRGDPTVVLPGFKLQGLLTAIERYRISHIYVVPPVVVALTKSLRRETHLIKHDLSSLRSILCGAAPLGKELIDACSKLFPSASFLQIYGLSEVTGAATLNDVNKTSNYASVGTILSSMEAKVVGVDCNEPLPPNHEGELLIRGPTTMIGYMNDPRATSLAFHSDAWLRTGDLVYFDENGHLYVVDRIKELIKYKALQVAPAELEALLLSHPQVLDAAVVPYNSQDAGQIPMAFIVLTSEAHVTADEIKAFVAERVAPYKRVRRVAFTNVIPKTASGKILRKELLKQI